MLRKFLFAIATLAIVAGPTQAHAEDVNPALFVVRDADSTLYLFGTIHVRPNDSQWADEDVRNALAQSEEIWTELLMTPENDASLQQLALQYGRAPAGRPLSSWLSVEENAQLDRLTTQLGIPTGGLEPFQPWLAALTLTVVPIVQAGFDPASGVDRQVDAFGDANGKVMRAFETPEQQLGFFANLPEEAQRQFLRESLAGAEAGVQLINEMTTAWNQGDIEGLERTVIQETRESYPELYQAIFVQRNNAWMQTLVRELEGSGVDFVAVGAGHLLGDEGLVEQFRARGYTVERVG